MPQVIMAPSIITNMPRRWAREHSDCQVGTVEVLMPLPKPVTHRPMMSWARVKEVHCRMAPMIMMEEPRKMARRRPSMLPIHMVGMEPEKQPRL